MLVLFLFVGMLAVTCVQSTEFKTYFTLAGQFLVEHVLAILFEVLELLESHAFTREVGDEGVRNVGQEEG